MPVVLQFAEPDGKLLPEQILRVLRAVAQHVVDAEHLRPVVEDHACIRSYRDLACRECIECIYGLVRRHVVRKVDDDVHLVRRQIVDLLDLDLSRLLRLQYGLDHYRGRLAVRNLSDRESVLVYLLDLRADLNLASLASAAVFRAVCRTSCQEVREDFEVLALQDGDGCVDQLVEVVRDDR